MTWGPLADAAAEQVEGAIDDAQAVLVAGLKSPEASVRIKGGGDVIGDQSCGAAAGLGARRARGCGARPGGCGGCDAEVAGCLTRAGGSNDVGLACLRGVSAAAVRPTDLRLGGHGGFWRGPCQRPGGDWFFQGRGADLASCRATAADFFTNAGLFAQRAAH